MRAGGLGDLSADERRGKAVHPNDPGDKWPGFYRSSKFKSG